MNSTFNNIYRCIFTFNYVINYFTTEFENYGNRICTTKLKLKLESKIQK